MSNKAEEYLKEKGYYNGIVIHTISRKKDIPFSEVLEAYHHSEVNAISDDKVHYEVIFTKCPECKPELVKEYVKMPSGEIVVKTEYGESLWFNKEGKHPKSYLKLKTNY